MRILVVEDNPERIKKFKRELIGQDVDYEEDAESAIRLVQTVKYDLIFLDHDLGGLAYVPSNDPNTGYQVAKAIKNTENESAYVIIHSCNSVGAQAIKYELPKAILAPFIMLNIRDCVEG